MTEQEKMKKGYLWGDDEENMALQAHAKSIVSKFNSLPPESMDERAALLKEVFGNVGENVWIVANVIAFGSPCKVYREINEQDEEYYFKDRRFDEQPKSL